MKLTDKALSSIKMYIRNLERWKTTIFIIMYQTKFKSEAKGKNCMHYKIKFGGACHDNN